MADEALDKFLTLLERQIGAPVQIRVDTPDSSDSPYSRLYESFDRFPVTVKRIQGLEDHFEHDMSLLEGQYPSLKALKERVMELNVLYSRPSENEHVRKAMKILQDRRAHLDDCGIFWKIGDYPLLNPAHPDGNDLYAATELMERNGIPYLEWNISVRPNGLFELGLKKMSRNNFGLCPVKKIAHLHYSLGQRELERMVLPRKAHEVADSMMSSHSVEYLASVLFENAAAKYSQGQRNEKFDKFWARQMAHAIVEMSDKEYKDFLPGRFLTYKRLARVIEGCIDVQNKDIAEIGSGSGICLCILARDGANAFAFDQSIVALDFFSFLAEHYGIERYSVRNGDFFNTQYPDNRFHVTFNVGVLEHLEKNDQKRLIEEMRRITVPNGLILVSIPNMESPFFQSIYHRELDGSVEQKAVYPEREFHFEVDMPALFREAGLGILEEDAVMVAPSYMPRSGPEGSAEYHFDLGLDTPLDWKDFRDPLSFWQNREKGMTKEERSKAGLFKYAIGIKPQ